MIEFIQKYWLGAFFAGIVSAVSFAWNRLLGRFKDEFVEQELIKQGVLALLHDRLYQAFKNCSAQGYITANQLNNLEHLYKSYHTLGGNSTGTELYHRCKNMEIKHE